MSDPLSAASPPVILFDGVCNLCNAAVRWVIARDPHARFRFASLQSQAGRGALAASNAPSDLPDSIVLIADGRVLVRSEAAIAIAARLGVPWSFARVAGILPRGVRDGLYAWVARNRYRWFGRQNSCMLPTPELRTRFLDAEEPRTE